jgi:hypothetical protein
MTTSIIARVRRVLRGNSDRALVHAVDDVGHEYKIEIPLEAVRDVREGADNILMLSWSLHVLAPAFEPTTAPASPTTTSAEPAAAAPTTRPSPSSVDQQFMDLMNRGRTTSSAAPATAPSTSTPVTASPSTDPRLEHELAARLGITGRPT